MSDEPYLSDRANGVPGVYCIARDRDGLTEYWTGTKWAAFTELLFDLTAAGSISCEGSQRTDAADYTVCHACDEKGFITCNHQMVER